MGDMNDKKIMELLRSLPKVEDERDPREIYQNISLKMNRKKRRSWMIPALAGAAALLLFVFLVPYLLSGDDLAGGLPEQTTNKEFAGNREEVQKDSTDESMLRSENSMIVSEEGEEKRESEIYARIYEDDIYSAVYDGEEAEHRLFIYPIPDQNGQILVPITVLAKRDENKAVFDHYMELMPLLKEEEWGLREYYPLKGELTLSQAQKSLHIDLPRDHGYDMGSSAEGNFMKVMQTIAASHEMETVTFSTEGNSGVNFAHTGYVESMAVDHSNLQRGYYFYHPSDGKEKPYLVPSNQSYESIREALNMMRENIETDDLQASIPGNFVIEEIFENEDLLIIQLDDTTVLTDDVQIIYTIEAILLTAKEFGFNRVKITNADLEKVGKFTFNEEWAVPLAPNRTNLNEK